MKNTACLSIGSNMGDRMGYLRSAVTMLQEDPGIVIRRISSIYETDPVGYTDQDLFLNAVLEIETDYPAEMLLEKCQFIEKENDRIRKIRWGPRTIDLDILLYNHENIETESLSVPHPRMRERAFVLIPLLELHPSIRLPEMDIPLADILQNLKDKEGVRLWKQKNGEDVLGLFAN